MKRTGGKLDILFNNTSTMYKAPAIKADPTCTHAIFNANIFGLFEMVSTFTPLLLASTLNT
ncbi:Glucose/ribitol dehydrogenase [Penicillium brevicompactum]|uniref:Glucose/ribitol dehydrogenase n=1 Tax=Penicillium brevicompactum TaxID=5074 RepID=UPI0025407751|nr:Glucose/ribitol dehydrogenase [Penicillium brevicompactum]KAJ5349055.1 Glucose/ribitol dehydrogenase [Penicillium brevicompactum]